MGQKGSLYRADDVPGTIELQVEKIGQLFNTFDPMPFRERDLDREAEEYIVGWARELPRTIPIRILIHIPSSEAASEHARELGRALNQYFRYRAEFTASDLKELFRVGRYSLLIGVVVLGACFTVRHFLTDFFYSSEFGRFLDESLIIFGWVANWKPIEIFLYDWWPILRRRQLFIRLATADIVVSPR